MVEWWVNDEHEFGNDWFLLKGLKKTTKKHVRIAGVPAISKLDAYVIWSVSSKLYVNISKINCFSHDLQTSMRLRKKSAHKLKWYRTRSCSSWLISFQEICENIFMWKKVIWRTWLLKNDLCVKWSLPPLICKNAFLIVYLRMQCHQIWQLVFAWSSCTNTKLKYGTGFPFFFFNLWDKIPNNVEALIFTSSNEVLMGDQP